jgi:hypothetical protein
MQISHIHSGGGDPPTQRFTGVIVMRGRRLNRFPSNRAQDRAE